MSCNIYWSFLLLKVTGGGKEEGVVPPRPHFSPRYVSGSLQIHGDFASRPWVFSEGKRVSGFQMGLEARWMSREQHCLFVSLLSSAVSLFSFGFSPVSKSQDFETLFPFVLWHDHVPVFS